MPENIYVPQEGDFYVYVYWNPLKPGCPPFYVGKGQGDRAFDHFWSSLAKKNPHKHRTIQSILKSGLKPIITCAWYGTDERQAFWVEAFFGATWKRKRDGGMLTNLVQPGMGGTTGYKHSDAAKRKMSVQRTGLKQSEETIRKRAASLRGHRVSLTSRLCPPSFQGRKHTAEAKRLISEAQRGSKHYKARAIRLVLPDGRYEQFGSMADAARAYDLSVGNLWSVLRGICPHTKGFKAEYLD